MAGTGNALAVVVVAAIASVGAMPDWYSEVVPFRGDYFAQLIPHVNQTKPHWPLPFYEGYSHTNFTHYHRNPELDAENYTVYDLNHILMDTTKIAKVGGTPYTATLNVVYWELSGPGTHSLYVCLDSLDNTERYPSLREGHNFATINTTVPEVDELLHDVAMISGFRNISASLSYFYPDWFLVPWVVRSLHDVETNQTLNFYDVYTPVHGHEFRSEAQFLGSAHDIAIAFADCLGRAFKELKEIAGSRQEPAGTAESSYMINQARASVMVAVDDPRDFSLYGPAAPEVDIKGMPRRTAEPFENLSAGSYRQFLHTMAVASGADVSMQLKGCEHSTRDCVLAGVRALSDALFKASMPWVNFYD